MKKLKLGDRVRVVGGKHDCKTGRIVASNGRALVSEISCPYLDGSTFAAPGMQCLVSFDNNGTIDATKVELEHIDDVSWSPYQ